MRAVSVVVAAVVCGFGRRFDCTTAAWQQVLSTISQSPAGPPEVHEALLVGGAELAAEDVHAAFVDHGLVGAARRGAAGGGVAALEWESEVNMHMRRGLEPQSAAACTSLNSASLSHQTALPAPPPRHRRHHHATAATTKTSAPAGRAHPRPLPLVDIQPVQVGVDQHLAALQIRHLAAKQDQLGRLRGDIRHQRRVDAGGRRRAVRLEDDLLLGLLGERKLGEEGVDVVLIPRQSALGAAPGLVGVLAGLALGLGGAEAGGELALLLLGLLALSVDVMVAVQSEEAVGGGRLRVSAAAAAAAVARLLAGGPTAGFPRSAASAPAAAALQQLY
jgi:hypothetical protein